MSENNKKTTYHYFKGTTNYASTTKVDDYGNYTIHLEFADDNELDKFNKSGIQLKLLADGKSVYFKRKKHKIFKDELVDMGPPIIIDSSKNELKQLIGKGSEVVVKVRAYDTVKGKGHTLDTIMVTNLVKVEGGSREYDF